MSSAGTPGCGCGTRHTPSPRTCGTGGYGTCSARSYRRADLTDKKGFDDRIGASINKMKKNSVLLPTEDDDRWEVSPVLGLVFTADEVAIVTVELQRLVATA